MCALPQFTIAHVLCDAFHHIHITWQIFQYFFGHKTNTRSFEIWGKYITAAMGNTVGLQ